jgi:hypothetical protein
MPERDNMKDKSLVAVLTGDVVGFSKLERDERNALVSILKYSFSNMDQWLQGKAQPSFQMYRGDSFQGVLFDPLLALDASLAFRVILRSNWEGGRRRTAPDLRIAVGIGEGEKVETGQVLEADGEAFRLSGRTLDSMSGEERLVVCTPWQEVNAELRVETALLDSLANRWSAEQAEAVGGLLRGQTQKAIASSLGISQPAVTQRLKDAGGWAVELLRRRYRDILGANLGIRP